MSELMRRRRSRSDRGLSRLNADVERKLQELLGSESDTPPSVASVMQVLAAYCKRRRLSMPSRGTVYNAMSRVSVPRYAISSLPSSIQRTLHNVAEGDVPGDQVVFAAFNYGDTRAMSYAASLPWSCLSRASRLRGWRPKSEALLRAVMGYRGI